eukprot:TRINITY_DN1630_c0_g1_i1.p1 TRINITY_DN1630_c0_g1~~TRINITY_DN1630_c0_g1_i1.p1  ORF type:complete len:433 (+),score=97.48 TRINITY_DN1630_c0_g1_i1:312-1610(+)
MEDRFISMEVKDPGNEKRTLRINAVLDGHGGEFAADYVRTYLMEELSRKLRGLLLLSNFKASQKTFGTTVSVQLLERCQKCKLSASLLDLIGVSADQYANMTLLSNEPEKAKDPKSEAASSSTNESSKEEPLSFGSSTLKALSLRSGSPPQRGSKVASRPTKRLAPPPPITNSPQFLSEERKPHDDSTPNQLSFNTSSHNPRKPHSSRQRDKTKQKNGSPSRSEVCLLEYYSGNGGGVKSILYPKLLRNEINNVDKHLIKVSKEKCSYAGTTLILSILDDDNLWVANVGDSRGVLCGEKGVTLPLSYDHKPSQLKEKKRIEESGGFVSMKGVWRVQGILATSRALGDFPLKDKNLIICDPDILSFSLEEHKPQFMLLASDGLWDTHSNEEVVKILVDYNKAGGIRAGLKFLTNDAMDKGSLDNITILVHTFS